MASIDDGGAQSPIFSGFSTSLTHCLLVVVGEPFQKDYIELIVAELEKGLKNWTIEGEAAEEYGDVLKGVAEAEPKTTGLVHVQLSHAGSHLGVTVLINPSCDQLSLELRGLLLHPSAHKHVVYGGHSLEGTGDWVLGDDTYTLHDITEVFNEPDVDAALLKVSQDEKQTLCISGSHWSTAAITKQPFSKSLNLAINPQETKNEVDGISALLETIQSRIHIPSPFDLMEPPTMGVGIKCKITKPTVLIFPAAKGDCAFFAVSDFSTFVGGGYNVKSCFWKFAKHLHRVDAVIVSHTQPNSIIGINSLLRRKIAERQLEAPEPGAEGYEDWQVKCNSPEVGVVYMNAPDGKHSPKSLVLKTVSQGNETTSLLQELAIKPLPCVANGGKDLKPITLYLKVGIGKLDMYILSPVQDSKELKDFLQQWSAGKAFGKAKTGVKVNGKESEVPLPNACSICALMVWQPASPHENIVRVLFPGNAPQNKILEGLDKMKSLDFLKFPDAVQTSSGKIAAMKKKDLSALKRSTSNGSGAVNGAVNGKVPQLKKSTECNDGVNCNTPPPSPSGVDPVKVCIDGNGCNTPPPGNACIDGKGCNTPPPERACIDGNGCNTPPPERVCIDGNGCNTPPPERECIDGKGCNTPPPERACIDGNGCNTPPPENVCIDGKGCNTPPPEKECIDGNGCNTPPPERACIDGNGCNTPPPENICIDGKGCNTPPPERECINGNGCNTPPPENVCIDGKGCNTPPENVCIDGKGCNTPPPENEMQHEDFANSNLNPEAVRICLEGLKEGSVGQDNTCKDGKNCNTPPPEEECGENGVHTDGDSFCVPPGFEDNSLMASSDDQLPESQQGLASDVNSNPANPALKVDVGGLQGAESPDRLASGEITPADQVEYGMEEELDGLSSGHGTVENTPEHPEPPSQPMEECFGTGTHQESTDIQPDQASSGVEMEDVSPLGEQSHPWEPRIELSGQAEEQSASDGEVLMGSPEIQVTEPAEVVSEAIDSEELVGPQGSLDASGELDESSEEISQASEIEVKPVLLEDEAEGRPQGDHAPESEQEMECDSEEKAGEATEPEADQQGQTEEDIPAPTQFTDEEASSNLPVTSVLQDDIKNHECEEDIIVKETDLDEAVKETNLDNVSAVAGVPAFAGEQEPMYETNLDEVESAQLVEEDVKETNLDEVPVDETGDLLSGVGQTEVGYNTEEYGVPESYVSEDTEPAAPAEAFEENSNEVDEQVMHEDSHLQESAQEIVQGAVEAAVEVVEREHSPTKQIEDEFAAQKEEELLTQREEEVVQQREEELVQQRQEEVVQQREEELVTQKEEELVPQNEEELVPQREEELVQQGQEEVVQQREEELVTQKEEELLQERKEELVQQGQEEVVQGREVDLEAQREEELLQEREEELVQQKEDHVDDAAAYEETDVDTGKEDIVAVEDTAAQEESEVKDEDSEAREEVSVSVTEPTISDSLEQNATDSLEDLRNEPASDVDIPPVVEEEVCTETEQHQESIPDSNVILEAAPSPPVDIMDVPQPEGGEDDISVPADSVEEQPESAKEPVVVGEASLLQEASLPCEPAQEPEQAQEQKTVLEEPLLQLDNQAEDLPKTPEPVALEQEEKPASVSVAVVEKSSTTKTASKSLKDKAKKPTEKTKSSDTKTKSKTLCAKTTTISAKKSTLEKKPSSEPKTSVKKTLEKKPTEKKPSEKKPSDKKTPADKKTPLSKKVPAETKATPDKKTPAEKKLVSKTRPPVSSSAKSADRKTTSSASASSSDGPSKRYVDSAAKKTASTPTSRPGSKPGQRPATGGRPSSAAKKPADSKTERPTKSAPSSRGDAKANGAKKAASKAAPASKAASIPASGPAVFLDLAYIPNHASADSVNSEFFRRIRAKNYVISANDRSRNQPAIAVLDALLEGKTKWEDSEAEVTVIPTYDYLGLRDWELTKHQELSKAKVEISQPACRSIVQMKDENFFMYKVEL